MYHIQSVCVCVVGLYSSEYVCARVHQLCVNVHMYIYNIDICMNVCIQPHTRIGYVERVVKVYDINLCVYTAHIHLDICMFYTCAMGRIKLPRFHSFIHTQYTSHFSLEHIFTLHFFFSLRSFVESIHLHSPSSFHEWMKIKSDNCVLQSNWIWLCTPPRRPPNSLTLINFW